MFARAAESSEDILAVLEDAILYPVDCEKGEGIEIAERYKVRGYPTFKMVNGKGQEISRWIGYEGPVKWSANVASGLADQRTLVAKAAAYEKEPTMALAKALASAAATDNDYRGAVDFYRQARTLDPNPMAMAEYSQGILTNMFHGARSGQFTFAEVDAEAQPVINMPMAPGGAKMNVAMMVTYLAKSLGEPAKAIPYLEKARSIAVDNDDEEVKAAWADLAVDHALLVSGDKVRAFKMKKASMHEGWRDDADQLNAFAWWCFENDLELEEAEKLALRGVKLADSDSQRANILDTAAEICNARGNCDEAIARIKEAIALDPEKEYFQNQLVRFEEVRQEKKG